MTTTLPDRRVRYDTGALLSVAARVFTERGYDGTSMDDIARATGLSKSSLYHHTAGKEQLLRLALERALDPLFAVVAEPAAREGRAIARLEHVVRRVVDVLADRLPYVTLLLRGPREHRDRAVGAGASAGLRPRGGGPGGRGRAGG